MLRERPSRKLLLAIPALNGRMTNPVPRQRHGLARVSRAQFVYAQPLGPCE